MIANIVISTMSSELSVMQGCDSEHSLDLRYIAANLKDFQNR